MIGNGGWIDRWEGRIEEIRKEGWEKIEEEGGIEEKKRTEEKSIVYNNSIRYNI